MKRTIAERFGVDDIPDGYLFFPGELGGLEVKSPFIGLLEPRDEVPESPAHRIEEFLKSERAAYARARKAFETGALHDSQDREWPSFRPADPDAFMPFEEYARHRETLRYGFDGVLRDVFLELLRCPGEETPQVDHNAAIGAALGAMSVPDGYDGGIFNNWDSMEPYWKWVTQLYGPEMVERFGGLNIVDYALLPIGMVNLFRSGRVQWQE